MTEELFREDATLLACEATVLAESVLRTIAVPALPTIIKASVQWQKQLKKNHS